MSERLEYLIGKENRTAEEARELLALLVQHKDVRDQRSRLELYNLKRKHHKQLEFHAIQKPLKCYFGGNRAGKSLCSVVDDIIQLIDVEWLEEHAPHLVDFKRWTPPIKVRVGAPDFKQGIEQVIVPLFRDWTPVDQLKGDTFEDAYSNRDRILRFANGSEVYFNTYEQDRSAWGGVALNRVHFDEEPPLELYEESLWRTASTNGDILISLTPFSGMSWVFDNIWERRDSREDLGVICASIHDNPFLNKEAKTRILADPTMSAEQREAREFGHFVHFAGLVIPEFKPDTHVMRKYGQFVPPDHDVMVMIDPGIRDPTAVVYLGISPKGAVHAFDEIYVQDKTIEEVCFLIHRKNWQRKVGERSIPDWPIDIPASHRGIPRALADGHPHGVRATLEARAAFYSPHIYLIDPSAQARSRQTNRTDQMEFAAHFVPSVAASNSLDTGIHRLKAFFQSGRLTISPDCPHLIDELRRYRWRSEPKHFESSRPEKPIDRANHAVDALRYGVLYLPPDGSPLNLQPHQDIAPAPPNTLASLRQHGERYKEAGFV